MRASLNNKLEDLKIFETNIYKIHCGLVKTKYYFPSVVKGDINLKELSLCPVP